jgi:hypothetical protein
VIALGLATATSLRVTTGPRGVDVRCGAFGWPRFTYQRERIVSGEVVMVSIWRSWTGGINWTPRGGWVFVLRSGPSLRLSLTNGRQVTVAVTNPLEALGGCRTLVVRFVHSPFHLGRGGATWRHLSGLGFLSSWPLRLSRSSGTGGAGSSAFGTTRSTR